MPHTTKQTSLAAKNERAHQSAHEAAQEVDADRRGHHPAVHHALSDLIQHHELSDREGGGCAGARARVEAE